MEKVKIATNAFVYPMPVVMVGTMVEGKINYMPVGWVSRVNLNPPMMGITLRKAHYTARGIRECREFGISVPGIDLIKEVDYAGLVSGSKVDKSTLLQSFFGELKNAPMIKDCPLAMECRIVEIVELPSHDLFIGEIVGAYTEERFLTDGKPDIVKMCPFTLTMPDNRYWKMGEAAGAAWSIGKELKAGNKAC